MNPQHYSSPQSQEPQRTSPLAIISIILAFLLPPLGFIVSVISLIYLRMKKQKSGLATIAAVISGIITFIFGSFLALVGSTLFLAGGGGKPNQAFNDIRPMIESIQSIGGTEICTNGDNGYSISNRIPWYQSYIQIPDSSSVTTEIVDAAASRGVVLQEQSEVNDINTADASEVYDASVGPSEVRMYVYRDTSVPLRCGVGEYGREQATGSDVIILLTATSPETSR